MIGRPARGPGRASLAGRSRRARFAAVLAALLLAPPLASAGRVVDQRGREHDFAAPAERVVTIAIPHFWIYLAVDGGPQHVVGANPTAVAQMRPSLLNRIFPTAAAVPTGVVRGGTFTPNIEELLRLRPDAVFQWADRGDALIEALDAVGLRAIGVRNTASESDFTAWVTLMGEASGRQDRVARMLADRAAALAQVNAAVTAVPPGERPRVLVLQQFSSALVAVGGNSYEDIFIRRAGGINVAGGIGGTAGNASVGMEQVFAWAPEIILLSQFEARTPADLYADPLWGALPAVRDRRVYKIPFGGSRWGGSDQETPLFWAWLAQLQHPGRFDLHLLDQMREQYRFLYGHDLTATDIEGVLQASQNAGSAHYDQFRAR